MKNAQRRASRRRKRNRILWGRLFLLIAILMVIGGLLAFGALKGYEYVATYQSGQKSVSKVEVSATLDAPIKEYKKFPLQQEAIDQPMYVLTLIRDEQKSNELEAIYLVSLNKEQKLIDIIGIPPLSKIMSRDKKTATAIATAYHDGGLDLTKALVEDIFHIQIPYFVVMDKMAFDKVATLFGNLSFYVEDHYTQYDESGSDIVLIKGVQTMNPTSLWAYMIYDGAEESGIEQVQRQERIIKSMMQKENSSSGLLRAVHLGRVWGSIESNISTWDAMTFALFSTNIGLDRVSYYILPGVAERIDNKRYWTINPTEAQHLVGITLNQERK